MFVLKKEQMEKMARLNFYAKVLRLIFADSINLEWQAWVEQNREKIYAVWDTGWKQVKDSPEYDAALLLLFMAVLKFESGRLIDLSLDHEELKQESIQQYLINHGFFNQETFL